MKILIFSLAYYPKYVGGAEVAIKEITDRIPPNEIEFDMVTCRLDKTQVPFEKIGNIKVHRIGIGSKLDKILFPILGTIKVFKLHKEKNYDAFWTMMVTFSSGAAYIFNILRKLKGEKVLPTILTLQEGDSEEHIRSRHFGMIALSWKLALKRTQYLTVISNYLSQRATHFGYKGKIFLVPNGVNYEYFSKVSDPDHIRFLREKMGKKPEDIYLITTSRLVEKNDVGSIIESLKYLSPNIYLLILGIGDLEKELKKKVKELNYEKRVKFLGYIPHTELPAYLQLSDIFIRPALSEGFGNSYIEAMAAGLPVIATPVGGIVDFLSDGETGLFCEVKNPQSIAQKVEKILKDKESCEYIVNNARNMVKEKYEWKTVANSMKNDVFLKVI